MAKVWVTVPEAMALSGLSEGRLASFAARETVQVRPGPGGPQLRVDDLRVAIDRARVSGPRCAELADDGHLGLAAAAGRVGIGHGMVLRAVHAGELQASRSGRRWYITLADLEAWAEAMGLDPLGPQTGGFLVGLLERVLAQPGWGEERVALALGVHPETVRRWRQRGVPNRYIRRVRSGSCWGREGDLTLAGRRPRSLAEGVVLIRGYLVGPVDGQQGSWAPCHNLLGAEAGSGSRLP